MKRIFLLASILTISGLFAQKEIPSVYNTFHYEGDVLVYENDGQKLKEFIRESPLTLDNVLYGIKAYDNGLAFDLGDDSLNGIIYYGLINYEDSKQPVPVWYKRIVQIQHGKAKINIRKRLSGKYDMSGWESKGVGTLGYRIVRNDGQFLYEGKISFGYDRDKGFSTIPTIIEGPFVNLLTNKSVTISYKTDQAVRTLVELDGQEFSGQSEVVYHEITIKGLVSDKDYTYTVIYGDKGRQSFTFKTPPRPGSRKPFVFAYSSDSRSGKGGGERDMYGVNFYAMRRIGALSSYEKASFIQFTGDLINGYSTDIHELELEYANWKRAIEPFTHYFPVYISMGNHEALITKFDTTSCCKSLNG
jgi:hypothetical protein